MPQNWRLKVYLVLFAALVSAYVLIPSFFGFNALQEEAERTGASVPWYVKLFPSKALNLGLDLRGGIYVELEVSVEEAIHNRLDLMASELTRYLKEQKVEGAAVDRIPQTNRLRALVPDASAADKLREHAQDYYRGALVEARSTTELTFRSTEKDENKLQALYNDLVKGFADKKVEVERSGGSDLFRLVLKEGTEASTVRTSVSTQFGALQAVSEPNKVILEAVPSYIQKLRSDSVKQAVETIRNRIDRYGVAEPSIRQLGENRVVVELPGVTDPERAISIVKKSGKLEFKMVDDSKSDEEVKVLVAELRKDANIPEGFTEETVAKINEAAKGKIPADDEILFEMQRHPTTNKIVGGIPYLLKRKAEVTGEMLRAAQVSVQNNEPYVSLSFNAAGTKAFADLTAANVGKRLAIILDGNVTKAPQIKSAIPSGEAQITLGFGSYDALLKEAEDLVLVLREGALPASLKEITKTIIGPSLGKSAIRNGLMAALIAGATVVIFMILYYKGSGFIANLVLALNVLLILGLLALFQATLTLPGIAGIVLTMGMALDASVLIFERIREEIKAGKPVKAAVDAGFSNAFSAVVDTHLTTFLSGVVLYNFGTGPIRGFAVTLMIGVATTLFTAYWAARLVFDYLTTKVKVQKVSI
jgi:protein-export membrane protein SecD